ncbi:MAG: class I SAM-dependent RNA methyltransferase [Gemmatimonadota bacterium]
MATIYSTWCACAPGLEKLLAAELTALGLKPKEIEPGGMTAAMSAAQLYAANLHASVAGRISVRLGRFHASEFWELEKRAERLAWHAWVPKGGSIAFRVTSRKSRLYHNDAIAERLGALIAAKVPGVSVATTDGDDDEPQDSRPTTPDQLFLVRLVNDEVTISVDSSGELLYRRGWRQETAKAPLRETLAAAMLTASGWTGATPLHDPFCGAGTIVIEAARRLRRIPAGWDRHFAFERWPTFDAAAWSGTRADAEAHFVSAPKGLLLGSDRDPGAIRAALANARRAGVAKDVKFAEVDIRELPPAEGTHIVTNPPYGVRVDTGGDPSLLYSALGRLANARETSLTFLSPDHTLTQATLLKCRTAWRTTNGGIPIECLLSP